MAKPGKIEVEVDWSRMIEGLQAAAHALAGMSTVMSEFAENLRRIGVDKEPTTL